MSVAMLPEEMAALEPSSEDLPIPKKQKDKDDQASLVNEVAPNNLKPIQLEPMSLALELPWDRVEEQEKRFKRIVIGFLIFMLMILLVLTFSPVTERQKAEDDKIVAKTKVILKPVTVKPYEPEKPKPKPKPQPPKQEVAKQKPKAQAKTASVKPKTAEKKPVSHGLSAVSSQLSALRSSFDLTRNQKKNVSVSKAGKTKVTSRTLLGKDSATKKSDGIKIESSVMLDDRTTLAAHNAAAVQGIDHGGVDGGNPTSRYASHMSGERTMESIRHTIEKYRGGIFTLYHRAQSQNESLSGKYSFEMLIEPNGVISELKLISSELNDGGLDAKVLERIRKIKFAEKDVLAARVTYTFHFLPN